MLRVNLNAFGVLYSTYKLSEPRVLCVMFHEKANACLREAAMCLIKAIILNLVPEDVAWDMECETVHDGRVLLKVAPPAGTESIRVISVLVTARTVISGALDLRPSDEPTIRVVQSNPFWR